MGAAKKKSGGIRARMMRMKMMMKKKRRMMKMRGNHGHPSIATMWGPIRVKSRPTSGCVLEEDDANFTPGDKSINCNAGSKHGIQEFGFKLQIKTASAAAIIKSMVGNL